MLTRFIRRIRGWWRNRQTMRALQENAEFDRALAEEGLEDYARLLERADKGDF